MANHENATKEQFLNALLRDGFSYLQIADCLLQNNRNDFSNFQNVLQIIDNLSRHRTVLKEDLRILKELDDEIGPVESEEEDEESLISEEFDESQEEEEDENILIERQFFDWIRRFSRSVIHRKNLLMKLEMQLLEKLNHYGKQFVVKSELSRLLQNYHAMAAAALEQTNNVQNCFKKNARFTGKCEKLGRILARINEGQNFWDSK